MNTTKKSKNLTDSSAQEYLEAANTAKEEKRSLPRITETNPQSTDSSSALSSNRKKRASQLDIATEDSVDPNSANSKNADADIETDSYQPRSPIRKQSKSNNGKKSKNKPLHKLESISESPQISREERQSKPTNDTIENTSLRSKEYLQNRPSIADALEKRNDSWVSQDIVQSPPKSREESVRPRSSSMIPELPKRPDTQLKLASANLDENLELEHSVAAKSRKTVSVPPVSASRNLTGETRSDEQEQRDPNIVSADVRKDLLNKKKRILKKSSSGVDTEDEVKICHSI